MDQTSYMINLNIADLLLREISPGRKLSVDEICNALLESSGYGYSEMAIRFQIEDMLTGGGEFVAPAKEAGGKPEHYIVKLYQDNQGIYAKKFSETPLSH